MNNKKINVSRDFNLLQKVVIVDGQGGCGKTLLTTIIASLNRVELFNFLPEIENICILEDFKKISKDASETMIKTQMDLCLYEVMMSRRTNFRYSDLSSAFKNVNFFKYLQRLFQKGDEFVPQKIINEKPILHYAAHNLLGYSDPIFRSLQDKLVFIEVVRHPLYMVIQNMINHINILRNAGEAKYFRVSIKYKNAQLPYQAVGNESLFTKLNPAERSIYDIQLFTSKTAKFKKNMNFKYKKSLITIPFEQFVLKPYDYIKNINNLLETSSSRHTANVLKKQRVPRKKISDGIPLEIYKRFGWEPGEKYLDEKNELNKRREYIIKKGVSNKYLKILDELSVNYEKKFLKGII